MKRKTRNDWNGTTSEGVKLSILNYNHDYFVIEGALHSLEVLKRDVLPKHINLQTSAFFFPRSFWTPFGTRYRE